MSQQEKIKFVVKNGRYAGSVIELDADHEYSLGRSFHCDIAIDDPRFAERQMLLNVSAEGVQIKLLAEGKLSVNGESKDTKAQSEWRHMDPTSTFVMNDLEFSFEVPESMELAYQESRSHNSRAASTASHAGARTQQSTNNAAVTAGQEFEELETQVPDDDDYDRPRDDVEIAVLPSLADDLDFDQDRSTDSRYANNSRSEQTTVQKLQSKPYLIAGVVVVAVLLFSGLAYLAYLEPQIANEQMAENMQNDFPASPDNTDQQESNLQINDQTNGQQSSSEPAPFVYQDADQAMDDVPNLAEPDPSDPFAAYDQQAQSNPLDIADEEVLNASVPASSEDFEESAELEAQPKSVQSSMEEKQQAAVIENVSEDVIGETDKYQEPAKPMTGFGQLPSGDKLIHLNRDRIINLAETKEEDAAIADGPAAAPATNSAARTSNTGTTKSSSGAAQDYDPQKANQMMAVMRGNIGAEAIALQQAQDLLAGLGLAALEVSTRDARAGEDEPVIVVRGYVDDRRVWMRAKGIMEADLQGIGTFIDNVSSPEVRKAQLERWIASSDIKGKVQTYLSDRGLVAKVNLTPSQASVWEEISRRYVEKFDNRPELFVMRDPGNWLKVRSISFGERPYVVTEDGSVLTPGARLKNGYSVVSINRSGIELKDKFGSYTYVF